MKRKILSFILMCTVLLFPVLAQAKGFSGGSSRVHSSSSISRSYSSGSGTYHSGYKSPSASVQSKQPAYHSNSSVGTVPTAPAPSKRSSFLSHAAAFGAGALLGHMLHPFGTPTVGAMGGTGFSFGGLLMDAMLVLIIIWIVRRIFARR